MPQIIPAPIGSVEYIAPVTVAYIGAVISGDMWALNGKLVFSPQTLDPYTANSTTSITRETVITKELVLFKAPYGGVVYVTLSLGCVIGAWQSTGPVTANYYVKMQVYKVSNGTETLIAESAEVTQPNGTTSEIKNTHVLGPVETSFSITKGDTIKIKMVIDADVSDPTVTFNVKLYHDPGTVGQGMALSGALILERR